MKHVEFIKEFRRRTDAASVRVYPAGWQGPVDDETAEAAAKAGVLKEAGDPGSGSPDQSPGQAGTGAPADGGGADDNHHRLDSLTVKELTALAERKGVDLAGQTKKADIVAAFETAGFDRGVRADWRGLIVDEDSGAGTSA